MTLQLDTPGPEQFGDDLEELLAAEPFLTYATFAPIGQRPGAAAALHRRRWESDAREARILVARSPGGRAVAALRWHRRTFESDHFSMAMAGVEAPLAMGDDAERLAALVVLYRALFADLRARGFEHVAAHASTQDRAACWAAQEAGCFHVGTRITWMAPLDGKPLAASELPDGLRIELFVGPAIADLDRTCWRRLHEWSGRAFDRGPLIFDAAVSRERAATVYQVWTEKALTGEWADVLLLVFDRDEVVAFNSMRPLPDLGEAAGVGILGRGIGASLPEYRGLFTALQKECAFQKPLGASFLENEAQAATIGSIRVFGRLGHHCLHSTASLHCRLDVPPRRGHDAPPTHGDDPDPAR